MPHLLILALLVLAAIVLAVVVALAPRRSRSATYGAALLAPALFLGAWRVSFLLPPMDATAAGRDPTEALDLWIAGAALTLVLAGALCVGRVAAVALRTLPGSRAQTRLRARARVRAGLAAGTVR